MAQLANRRHELFCLEVASGAPLATAYVAAGYREGRGYDRRHNASRLRNQPHIKERVNELLAQSAERAVVGIGWVQLQLLDVVNGKVPSKTVTNSKGEKEETFDRQGALAVLARTLGAGGADVTVTATAAASASAEIDVRDMSSAELARRISSIIEDAARADGAIIDVTPAASSIDQAAPASTPIAMPTKDPIKGAVLVAVNLARQLRHDRAELKRFHGLLSEAVALIGEEIAAHA
jgi:hypothetical protein